MFDYVVVTLYADAVPKEFPGTFSLSFKRMKGDVVTFQIALTSVGLPNKDPPSPVHYHFYAKTCKTGSLCGEAEGTFKQFEAVIASMTIHIPQLQLDADSNGMVGLEFFYRRVCDRVDG